MKKDPLKDDRIFPEEMQQKKAAAKVQTEPKPWLLTVLGIIIIIFVLFLGYRHYQKNFTDKDVDVRSLSPETLEEMSTETADTYFEERIPLEPEERAVRINALLGN